jgi:protein Mpv17
LAESDGNLTGGSNLYSRYMDLLDRRPFVTQSISAGIISALGDVLSQWIELKRISLSLNWVRLIAFWICGTLYVGPFIHLWYNQLWKMGRWMERKYQTSKRIQTLAQVIVDQTVGVAFFFPAYFYSYEYIEALITWRGTYVDSHTMTVLGNDNSTSSLSPCRISYPLFR